MRDGPVVPVAKDMMESRWFPKFRSGPLLTRGFINEPAPRSDDGDDGKV